MSTVHVTPSQVCAARLRVACDRKLRRQTPDWIKRLAATPIPTTKRRTS